MRPESGIWIAINWPKIGKMTMTSKFVDITSSCHFLTFFLNFFCQFSCWFKFHVNIIAGSGVTTIFFYKGLTRNPEIRNTAVWVLPNIWRLGQVRDNKFGMNASSKMLLNAAKCQSYSFYCFWVIKGKPNLKITPSSPLSPTQIRVKVDFNTWIFSSYLQAFQRANQTQFFLLPIISILLVITALICFDWWN